MWDYLRQYAKNYTPGMIIETSLLGPVYPCRGNSEKELIGYIPPRLQIEARANRFTIIAADYKRNVYILRIDT